MAPNGTSRKTPTPTTNGKTKTLSFFKTSTSKANKAIKVKEDVKKKLPVAKQPGTWDSDITTDTPAASTPTINRIPAPLASSFSTGHPISDPPDIVKCNHCKRPILRHKAKSHIEDCLLKKQEKQRKKKEAKDARDAALRADRARNNDSETPEAEDSILGGDGHTTTGGKTEAGGKKRKAEDEGVGGKKKKKKDGVGAGDAGKTKMPRPKAPVDVEKQCGVELPNGGQCARSLTCKSHSMGAKRAVPGRSAPYDKLLADYQRKNQAKLQKAALDAMEPSLDDDPTLLGQPIDSDEEKDLIMAALLRSRPAPLYTHVRLPLKSRYQMVRMKEMLGNALGGRGGGGLFRTGPREEGVGLGGFGMGLVGEGDVVVGGAAGAAGGGGVGGVGGAAGAVRRTSGLHTKMPARKPSVA